MISRCRSRKRHFTSTHCPTSDTLHTTRVPLDTTVPGRFFFPEVARGATMAVALCKVEAEQPMIKK